MQKAILITLVLVLVMVFLSSCYNNKKTEQITIQTQVQDNKIDELQLAIYYENKELMEFVKGISNIPSPTSNLKYITQTNNIFQVKYGDGMFTLLSNDTYPLIFGDCSQSMSMLPTFDCNDFIILKKVERKEELSIGDIIEYDNGNANVVHRLIKISNGRYYTRADNWNGILKYTDGKLDMEDGSITFDKIRYKVVGVIYR